MDFLIGHLKKKVSEKQEKDDLKKREIRDLHVNDFYHANHSISDTRVSQVTEIIAHIPGFPFN